MATATAAVNLGAHHSVATIGGVFGRARQRFVEARPAGAAFKLHAGLEERLAAANTLKRPCPFLIIERAASRPLGAVVTHDVVLLGRQELAPFRIRVGDRELLR